MSELQHWTNNVVLTQLGEHRLALRCHARITTGANEQPRIRSITGYDDVRRVEGRRRFARRMVAGWPIPSDVG